VPVQSQFEQKRNKQTNAGGYGKIQSMAHAQKPEDIGRGRGGMAEAAGCREGIDASSGAGREDVSNANGLGLEGRGADAGGAEVAEPRNGGWWLSEPRLDRMDHGLAGRVDRFADDGAGNLARMGKGIPARVNRLKAIGNGQVPATAAMAWKELMGRL
jgi:hypothetical protein